MTFVEGDDVHPSANVAKMRRGEPVTDADRVPWLHALRRRIDELAAAGRSAVVACSALKQAYRDVLASGRPEVRFIWLTAPPGLIRDRPSTVSATTCPRCSSRVELTVPR